MRARLHVIASCADRKRSGFGEELRLRAFRDRDPEDRLQHWWRSLSMGGSRLPAQDLYVGPYWSTVRDLVTSRACRIFSLSMWVASAGYGLVSSDAPLRPYSATFRPNAPDSVVRPRDVGFDAQKWWSALAALRLPRSRAPRSLVALAKSSPRSRLFVIGSPAYVSAMESDLEGALDVLGNPNRLLILSGDPGPRSEVLSKCWLPSTARLLARVGGSLPALHARVARQILNEAPRYGLDSTTLRDRWTEIAERSPEAMKPQRSVSTDDEVKQFIRTALQQEPKLRHTRLLRDFRANGRACEQSRFRGLYQQVLGEKSR